MPTDTFTLDTSGEVPSLNLRRFPHGVEARVHLWNDLTPFAQGYVEALFAGLVEETHTTGWAFRYLSPKALALILKDCGRFKANGYGFADDDSTDGEMLWHTRQSGEWADVGFPPLTISLHDDGKIHLAEKSQ